MSIRDALVRQEPQDVIEIGRTIEKALKGRFGDILYAIVEGLKKRELNDSKTFPGKLSSDRVLGRVEAYDEIINKLEEAMSESQALLVPEDPQV